MKRFQRFFPLGRELPLDQPDFRLQVGPLSLSLLSDTEKNQEEKMVM